MRFPRLLTVILLSAFIVHSFVLAQEILYKSPQNPVLAPSIGGFDDSYAYNGVVLKEGSTYRMWYTGLSENYAIGLATSSDGIHWVKYLANPVLTPGASFDYTGVRVSSVLKDSAGYKLYYYTGSGLALSVGLAMSVDGVTWTKYGGNPILAPDSGGNSWESVGTWNAAVIKEEGVYKMWYQGFDGQYSSTGYATSGDGIHWSRYDQNPVLLHGPGGSWDELTAGAPVIVRDDSNYHMYYTGVSASVQLKTGYAHSSDGIHWNKSSHNPVLTPGPNGWDAASVAATSAIEENGKFLVWYSGYGGGGWQLGLATTDQPVTGGGVDEHTVALWHFDEGSGNVLHDESPYHNDGTIHNCEWVDGKFGKGLHFNGLTSYIEIPNSSSLKTEGQFTVEVWLNLDTLQFDNMPYPDIGAAVVGGNIGQYPDGGGYDFGFHNGQGLLMGYRINGSPGYVTPGVPFPSTHNFHHVALTYERTAGPDSGTVIKFYIDGALVDSNKYPGAIQYNNTPSYYLGTGTNGRAVGGWGVREFPGIMDEYRISNIARPPRDFGSARLNVSPRNVSFGLTKVNEEAIRSVSISNASFYDTVHVDSITSTNAHFSANSTPFVLYPVSNHILTVTYIPDAATPDTGAIIIYPHEVGVPVAIVHVSGKGFAPAPAPAIASVKDIIGDQGKQVRIIWYPSMYDGQSDTLRVTQYTILRRVDDPPAPLAMMAARKTHGETFSSGTTKYVTLNGEIWDFVSTWPALHFEQYSAIAPTLSNVTQAGIRWSVFKIAATTASGEFFISDPDSGFSVDNIFPPPPGSLQSEYIDGKIVLSWSKAAAPDLEGYYIYRSTSPNLVSAVFNRRAAVEIASYTDSVITHDSTYYYIVTSFDSSGNESVQSNTSVGVHILGVPHDDGNLPMEYVMGQNYPNPFNPTTQITYGLPERSLVKLTVYNLLGQEISVLRNETESAGYHEALFAAPVASGIYFYKLEAVSLQHSDRSFTKVAKMVLMK